MCGFAGVLGAREATSVETLKRMTVCLRHRGPDDQGTWQGSIDPIGFAHTRLSVVDLSSAGHQPMSSANDRYVIAFNGEIYNHLDLRAEIEAAGLRPKWRGHADTETLLAGFSAWGIPATVKRLVGMFAFGVWDHQNRELTLGRDRLGEKPLYYGFQRGTFLFGSELKGLREHPDFEASIDRDAVAMFMRYGYVPTPHSIYRGIHKLPPGTLLRIRRGESDVIGPDPYWSVLDVARAGVADPFAGTEADAVDALESHLGRAVRMQQMSDVPVGAFLSGGVDSSTIVALMQSQGSRPVHTFTIGFEGKAYNEATHAAAVARHLGTRHTALEVTAAEAMAVIPRLPSMFDEPFADSSQIPTYLVSQLARRSVTVSLSGDGGDELFGGYNRYMWAGRIARLPAFARVMSGSALSGLSPRRWNAIYTAVEERLPRRLRMRNAGDKAQKLGMLMSARSDAELYQRLASIWADPETVVIGGRDRISIEAGWRGLSSLGRMENRMMAIDSMTYLPDDILCKVDRAAMAVSLETRVPFLDHRVVEFAWSLPLHLKIRDGHGKWVVRKLLDRHVPRELIDRPKMGFAIPIDEWLRGPLSDWSSHLLSPERLRDSGFLDPGEVQKKWREHRSGRRNWQSQLWNVLMFQAWLEEQN